MRQPISLPLSTRPRLRRGRGTTGSAPTRRFAARAASPAVSRGGAAAPGRAQPPSVAAGVAGVSRRHRRRMPREARHAPGARARGGYAAACAVLTHSTAPAPRCLRHRGAGVGGVFAAEQYSRAPDALNITSPCESPHKRELTTRCGRSPIPCSTRRWAPTDPDTSYGCAPR